MNSKLVAYVLVIDANVHDVKLLPCYPLGIRHECWLLIRKETF
jgi:hypothetical protein